ncbi:ATP-binding protein [Paenibacillus sp. 23TSA30-6]|uniref:ATP-binding protein n=1 Tax=Paenibacillus sp. 23TSA30-6 TaxID=2546104 RepID=UPI0017879AC2|nr:ATP-binding protein [Paenibacillus sp. 23TSA30-6]MBE0338711.1 ATP-binding protein [Paenibacillus sp. 23TSA30-6]
MESKDEFIYKVYIDIKSVNDWLATENILSVVECLEYNQIGVLDFSNLNDLNPYGVIMLLTINRRIYEITGREIKFINIRSKTLIYLEKVGFFKTDLFDADIELDTILWDEAGHELFKEFCNDLERITTLEEKRFVVEKIRSSLEVWLPEEKYRMLRSQAISAFMEISANALEHSRNSNKMGECFIMMQKYEVKNALEIYIVIADFGIGIRKHLTNKYGEIYKDDCSYIKEALSGQSGRKVEGGGFGLQSIQDIIANNMGSLIVRSNKGLVEIKDQIIDFEGTLETAGTQVAIILRKKLDNSL